MPLRHPGPDPGSHETKKKYEYEIKKYIDIGGGSGIICGL